MKSLLMAVLAAFLLLACRPAAWAQVESREGIELQNQILQLRHDLDAVQKRLSASGGSALGSAAKSTATAPANDLLPQLLDRVSALEERMRELRGRVDELDNRTQQQNADLGKQIGDLDFRVQTLEGGHPAEGAHAPSPLAGPTSGGGVIGGTATPPPSVSPPPTPLGTLPVIKPAATAEATPQAANKVARPTPEALLQRGNAALAHHDYAVAEESAQQVLATAKGPHAVDAQFLLGQSLEAQHDYQKAALAFDTAYKGAPTGPHAEDSLLGLAGALTALGAKPAACTALDKLRREFPTERAAVRERAAALRQRAGCG